MAYKKVWKKGKVDWGAALSNAAKKSAVAARKRQKDQERARKKAAREAEASRKRRAREAERSRKQAARQSAARVRAAEKAATASAKAAQRARNEDEKQRQKRLAQEQKEREKFEKELLTLKGRFLEHDVPLKLFDVDLREVAHDYNKENGLTTSSQFKKVTLPYLEENLFKLGMTIHFDKTFSHIYKLVLEKLFASEVSGDSKINILKKIAPVEEKSKAYLKGKLPMNISFDDFSNFQNPVNAEVISEYIDINIVPLIDEMIADTKKQEDKAKQKAKEKKEHDTGCKEVKTRYDKIIADAKKIGKAMNTQINKMKSDLESLDSNYKSSWFGKGKLAKEAQGLGSVIWKRTPGLIETILLIEPSIVQLKNRIEKSYADIHDNPNVNQTLEESGYYEETLARFKKLYGVLHKILEMRLTNLEIALSYYDAEKKSKAIERVKNKGLELSKDSNNLSNLFNKFGG